MPLMLNFRLVFPLVLKRVFLQTRHSFTELKNKHKIIGILNNSFGIFESERKLEVKDYISESLDSNVQVESIKRMEKKFLLMPKL